MPELVFRLHRGLLYIPITIVHGDNELVLANCIFDTGSGGTTFDTDKVAQIGIKSTAESKLKRLVAVGGHQTVFTHHVETLILGDEALTNVDIEVGNLHSRFGVDGILGTDVMKRFDWEIRFSTGTIICRTSP